jgi:hypothetical protein
MPVSGKCFSAFASQQFLREPLAPAFCRYLQRTLPQNLAGGAALYLRCGIKKFRDRYKHHGILETSATCVLGIAKGK